MWSRATMDSMNGEDRAWVAPETGVDPTPTTRVPPPLSTRGAPAPVVTPPAPIGPMTLSDILDGAYTVIKRRPRAVIGSAAVVIIPIQVLSVWLQSGTDASTEQGPYDALLTLSS